MTLLPTASAPLFRDPVLDGAADPVLVYNHGERQWWMIYTNRRATTPGPGYGWIHGTDLGVASSPDGGNSWLYRGTLTGLDFEWGRNTFWAPEIIHHHGTYHMYVSYIRGVPLDWNHPRHIHHFISTDLLSWQHHGPLALASERVIDACVFQLPDGRFRLWYKDEDGGSITVAADSEDLYSWRDAGPAITGRPHEGPKVFAFACSYWMIVDEWRGQQSYRSADLKRWEPNALIPDTPGTRNDDGGTGLHADVVVNDGRAFIFYFTHPGRVAGEPEESYGARRTSIPVAELTVDGSGRLCCDRNHDVHVTLGRPSSPDPASRVRPVPRAHALEKAWARCTARTNVRLVFGDL